VIGALAKLFCHFSPPTSPPQSSLATIFQLHHTHQQSLYEMALADYLAKNYLTADPAPPKKKRKKNKDQPSAQAGLIINDDSLLDPSSAAANSDDDAPTISGTASAEFRKSKKSNWQTIGAPAPKDADQAAADAIIAAAAEEDRERREAEGEEEGPAVMDGGDSADGDGVRMESGARAGLQTAAQTDAMVKAQREKRRRDEERGVVNMPGGAKGKEETIYRDASGRIINVAMKRAEARKKAEEEAAAEAAAKEAQKGDVQKREREERKQKLQDAKYMTLSRYADDAEMNDELRDRDRWNDPAAQFLETKKEGRSKSGLKLYQGAAAPNRYGIRPGHRWDGVDRGNGFEREWFGARNKVQRREELEYAWQMDE
jgi:pre-mRNA-splicing factor CWC26